MGSWGGSEGTSQPRDPTFFNPAAATVANMFGIGIDQKGGGLAYNSYGGGDMGYSSQLFDSGSWADIGKLINQPNFGAEGARGIMGGWDDYIGDVSRNVAEGIETGYRTDMDPIIAESQRVYRDETIPQLKEMFAGQTGSFSTDFLGATAQAGGAMGSQLGGLQAQMDEAAANRKAGLIPMAGMPGQLASMGLDLGAQYNLDATSGGKQATLLQMFGGMEPTAVMRSPYQQDSSSRGGVLK